MKKIIGFQIIALIISLNVQGQKTLSNNFITWSTDFNFNRNYNQTLFPRSYNRSGLVQLQYIRSLSETKAYRYGVGILYSDNAALKNEFERNDTVGYTQFSNETAAFYLSIGKEFRKILHKDVMIIGGADLGAGFGGASNYTAEFGQTDSLSYIRSVDTMNSGFITALRFTPFMGLRVSWKRLAIGYSIRLPWQLDYTSVNNSNVFSFNTNLQQSISFGYRLPHRKKKR